MWLDCFDYLNEEVPQEVGSQFYEIGDSEICRKYISPQTARRLNAQKSQKKKTHIEVSNFSKHVDTEQFKCEIDKIEKGSLISIHSKKHGTSGRYCKIKTIRQPKNIFQKVLKK